MGRAGLPPSAVIAVAALLVACACTSGLRQTSIPAAATTAGPVVPLLRTSPVPEAPSGDLDALLSWLGDAPLVGLGEDPHGVDDHHRLAHRIFAHSQEGGAGGAFGVFAMEVDQTHAARLDDFVQGRRDDLDGLLAERWYGSKMFYDDALRDLLLWMRAHNRSAPRPVHVAGYDVKQPDLALGAVADTLRRVDRQAAATAEALGETILSLGGYGLFPNVRGYTAALRLPLPGSVNQQRPRTFRAEVWVRSEGSSFGSVGMLASRVAGASGPARRSVELPLSQVGAGWMPLRLLLPLPADADAAEVWLYHRGNGSVWFDDLHLDLDGAPLGPEDPLAALEPWPLMMPKLQVMDYGAARDPDVAHGDGPPSAGSLRVTCDPRVDGALAAVRRLADVVESTLQAAEDGPSPTEALWTRRMVRLVEQAVHWRTLVEPNRDVFLAENLAWLQRHAFPEARVLALGHQSHTERIPRRMGSLLAERYGDRYRTVTLHAESGTYAYFASDVSSLDLDAPLVLHAVEEAGRRELVPYLAALGEGDLLVNLRDLAAERPAALPADLPLAQGPEVAILLRRVAPARVPGESTGSESPP